MINNISFVFFQVNIISYLMFDFTTSADDVTYVYYDVKKI